MSNTALECIRTVSGRSGRHAGDLWHEQGGLMALRV